MQMTAQKRLFGLDVLRAVAILLVMVSHTTYLLVDQDTMIVAFFRAMGATGVDLFFVLSGYLVGGLVLGQLTFSSSFAGLLNFWMRRWLRTLPNYFTVLGANVLLFWMISGPVQTDIWKYLVFIQNFKDPHPSFFTEAWSLSIEEYAYLILPLLLWGALVFFKKGFNKRLFLNFTIGLICVLFLMKLNYLIHERPETYLDWSSSFRKVVIYRLDSIYIGFILVYFKKHFQEISLRNKRSIAILSVVLFGLLNSSVVIFKLNPLDHLFFYTLVYLTLSIVCLCGLFPLMTSTKETASASINALVHYLSRRSYALYLVNYSIVLLSIQEFMKVSAWMIPLYWVLSIILSEGLYRFIERNFLVFRELHFPRFLKFKSN